MQKWEYKIVRTHWHQSGDDEVVAAVDGVPLVDPTLTFQLRRDAEEERPGIEAYIQPLGDEGWELVGVRTIGKIQSNARYIFKRPKP